MDHFSFKVGETLVRVHQAFRPGETPSITIISGDEQKKLLVQRDKDSICIEIQNE
jgi:hypothetical protein